MSFEAFIDKTKSIFLRIIIVKEDLRNFENCWKYETQRYITKFKNTVFDTPFDRNKENLLPKTKGFVLYTEKLVKIFWKKTF